MSETKQRAPLYRPYWTIMDGEEGKKLVQKVIERGDPFDDSRFASANYYLTGEAAASELAKLAREHRLGTLREYNKSRYWAKKAGEVPKGNKCPIRQLTLEGKTVAIYGSIREASEATGIPTSSISGASNMGYITRNFKWEKL